MATKKREVTQTETALTPAGEAFGVLRLGSWPFKVGAKKAAPAKAKRALRKSAPKKEGRGFREGSEREDEGKICITPTGVAR